MPARPSEGYRYPDPGDRVTATFIAEREPYPGYWAVSEERAFDLLGTRLAKNLAPRNEIRALDAGCGDGRLLGWLAGFASEITAADPDPERLAAARRRPSPPDTEITFQRASLAEAHGGPFDLIVCSHIVQHMATGEIEPALRNLHDLAAPDGMLVLAFSRAPVGHGGYTLDRDVGGVVRSEPVDRARFDEAAGSRARVGVLPVRHLDPEEFGEQVAAAGWAAEWDWTFHVLDDLGVLDPRTDRDELVNADPTLRRIAGRDLVTLWRRSR